MREMLALVVEGVAAAAPTVEQAPLARRQRSATKPGGALTCVRVLTCHLMTSGAEINIYKNTFCDGVAFLADYLSAYIPPTLNGHSDPPFSLRPHRRPRPRPCRRCRPLAASSHSFCPDSRSRQPPKPPPSSFTC